MPLPRWVEPQLSKLVEKSPSGPQWVHEIKFDGYRMAACIDSGKVQLLTRSGLDWKTAYIDGELCGVRADGVTSFELMQQASDADYGGLVYFAFDLLELDGENVATLSLLERKERLAQLLKAPPAGIVYGEHEAGDGEAFRNRYRRRRNWAGKRALPLGALSARSGHPTRTDTVPYTRGFAD
jgi:ATP-dependent DNA ligase